MTQSKKKEKINIPASRPGATPNQGGDAQKVRSEYDQSVDGLLNQHAQAWNFFWPIRRTWWDRERLLIAHQADSFSRSARSHVTDGHISTLALERQARVAAQLPTGTVYSLNSSITAQESALLANLILNKYIIPNANSQFDYLTKLRMSGLYASVYGMQPLLYDYRIDDEYIGPDFWLIPPRNFIPQPYKNSIQDCDWVMISTMVSVSYLENILKRKAPSWNLEQVAKLIELAKVGKTPTKDLDSSRRSEVENIREYAWPQTDTGPAARVELITKYEKGREGRWITFARDYKDIGALRAILNPHKSGRIPVVARQCFPLVDSIWGLGDFERGITLQKAKDSLINLYLDGVRLAIFPPLKIDPSGLTMSTIRLQAGARWIVKDPAAVSNFVPNASSLATFQGTYQFLTGALLNQFGTNDTASVNVQDTGNPQFGRTPAAIEAMQDREGARDNWDRFQLEQTVQQLNHGMLNLLTEKQEKPINFNVFKDDVKQIIDQLGQPDEATGGLTKIPPSYMTMLGGQEAAKLVIPKSLIKGQYQYIVDASSTLKADNDVQNEKIVDLLKFYFSNPQVIDQYLAKDNKKFNAGQAISDAVFTSNINNPDRIITSTENQVEPPEIDPEGVIAQNNIQDPAMQDAVRRMFGGNSPEMSPQPSANIPSNNDNPSRLADIPTGAGAGSIAPQQPPAIPQGP